MKKIKDAIVQIRSTKWGKIGLIVFLIAIINLFCVCLLKINPIVKAYTFVTNVLNDYTEETPDVEIKSKDYDINQSGSYKFINHAEWSGQNTVRVTSNIDTIPVYEEKYQDVIFMLDTSSVDEKNVCSPSNKSTIVKFAGDIIKSGGRIAIVTFDENATLQTDFTSDISVLTQKIDDISCNESIYNSYYKGFKEINSLLNKYTVEENRQLTIEILTDSKPTKDSPNDEIIYSLLKEQIKKLTFNVILYNDNKQDDSNFSKVSDNVYKASFSELEEILYQTIENREYYKEFKISEIINSEFFTIDPDSIFLSAGEYEITEEELGESLNVTIPDYTIRTGKDINISYTLKIKDENLGVSGYIPITNEIALDATLKNDVQISGKYKETPVLQTGYELTYNPNYPPGCKRNFNTKEKYYAYELVDVTEEAPTCDGYTFLGWSSKDKINYINSDQFLMSNHDTELIGTWSKITITSTLKK